MERLLAAVQDWPVVVQGALGSALFALIMFAGQKAFRYASDHFAAMSTERRRAYLTNEIVRLKAPLSTNSAEAAHYTALIWLRASRSLVRAFIWLTLGLIAGSLLSVLSVVGYLGCVYYLFSTLNVVGPISVGDDGKERLSELRAQLAELEAADG